MGFTLGKRVPPADERTENMIAGARASGKKWKERTLHPTANPVEAMADATEAYTAGVERALAEGRYGKGVASIDENEMVAAIQATPDSAVGEGMARRKAKILRKTAALAAEQEADAAIIDAMPAATPEDRKARLDKQWELGQTLKERVAARLAK